MQSKVLVESICADERINLLNSFEEVTYYRLLACCTNGEIDGRTRVLLPKLYPLRLSKVTEERLEQAIISISEVGLIKWEKDNHGTKIKMVGWKSEKQKEPTAEQKLLFEEFWKAYPRKESKQLAARSFQKTDPTREKVDKMLKAIDEQKQTRQWREDGGKYIPHPSTWLNHGNWHNETDGSMPIKKPQSAKSGMVDASEFFEGK